MKKHSIAAVLSLALSSPAAFADQRIKTRLAGYQEVPSVSTGASGELELVISRHNDFIDFEPIDLGGFRFGAGIHVAF